MLKRSYAAPLVLTFALVVLQALLLLTAARFDLAEGTLKALGFPLFIFTRLLTWGIDTFADPPPNAMEPASHYISEAEAWVGLIACGVAHLLFWYAFWVTVLAMNRRRRAWAGGHRS